MEVFLIDIDTIDMKINDTIFCGFEKLEYEWDIDGGEREEQLCVSSDNYILILDGYDPQTYDGEEDYSYNIESICSSKSFGITYCVKRNPKNYMNNKFYRSKVITLCVGWVLKNDFNDPDYVIDFALSNEMLHWIG